MTRPRWRRLIRTGPGRPARDRAAGPLPWFSERACIRLALAALALGFVLVGADGLDLGPAEARLGLASGGSAGPLGQVFGYWAPDLWPGEVLPSVAAHGSPEPRQPSANSAVVRLALGDRGDPWAGGSWRGGMYRSFGYRPAIWAGICWFGCLAVIDRTSGAGLDMILGAAMLAAIDRLLGRGADWVAGLWASLAFLAGGWPPLLLIGLVILVIGRAGSTFSLSLVLPRLATAIIWSILTIRAASTEAWASALALPLTRGLDWWLLLPGRCCSACRGPVRPDRTQPIDPGLVAGRRPGPGQGLAPGCAGLRDRRQRRTGPGPRRQDRRAGWPDQSPRRPAWILPGRDDRRRGPGAAATSRHFLARAFWPPGSSP